MDTAPLTSPFGEVAIETIEHLNDEHDDTVALIAGVMGGLGDVTSAQIVTVDHDGIGLDVVLTGGDRRPMRVEFANQAGDADQAYREFYNVLRVARTHAGDRPLTSIERELTPGVIPTWITTVTGVLDVTPRMRQITVAGGLERFRPLAPDQFVYVLAPPHGRHQLTIDASFSWEQYETLPEPERPVGAYYTVRRWHPETAALDLWVVLHGHAGDGERWAAAANVGDPVALWGPRQAYERPESCGSLLLLGDETALPAIAAILESLGADDTARVIVAIGDASHAIDLGSPATLDVTWINDTGSNPLLDALHAIAPSLAPDTYVWGGAESRQISVVRRFVRNTLGFARQHVSLTGYWRADLSH